MIFQKSSEEDDIKLIPLNPSVLTGSYIVDRPSEDSALLVQQQNDQTEVGPLSPPTNHRLYHLLIIVDMLSSIAFLITGVILINSSDIAMSAYLSFFITRLANLTLSITQKSACPRGMTGGCHIDVLAFKTMFNIVTLFVALGIFLAKGLAGFGRAELFTFIMLSLFGLFLSFFHFKLSNGDDQPTDITLPFP